MTERVLHVVVAGEIGGAERMLVDLVKGSPSRHFVLVRAANPSLLDFFQDNDVAIVDHTFSSETPLHYLVNAFGHSLTEDVRRAIRRVDANVVQVHTVGSQVAGTRAAIAEDIPLVRTEHSTRAYEDPSVIPFARWSLSHASAIACVSHHIAAVVRRWTPMNERLRRRITVIPNGVDTGRFAVTPMSPFTTDAPFTFALVGRLEPRKGIDLALDALALVPHARLLVIGEGPSRAELEGHAISVGVDDRVEFTGRLDDPRTAIGRARAMLSSSRKEALGIALLEGMSMGRPAIAPPTGGIPEFVTSKTGYLARARSAPDLANAMREAMNDEKRAERGEAAAALVRADYALNSMRNGYAKMYKELLTRTDE